MGLPAAALTPETAVPLERPSAPERQVEHLGTPEVVLALDLAIQVAWPSSTTA